MHLDACAHTNTPDSCIRYVHIWLHVLASFIADKSLSDVWAVQHAWRIPCQHGEMTEFLLFGFFCCHRVFYSLDSFIVMRFFCNQCKGFSCVASDSKFTVILFYDTRYKYLWLKIDDSVLIRVLVFNIYTSWYYSLIWYNIFDINTLPPTICRTTVLRVVRWARYSASLPRVLTSMLSNLTHDVFINLERQNCDLSSGDR